MNLQEVKELSLSNDWSLILPEIGLGVLALALLVLDLLMGPQSRRMIPGLCILALFGVLIFTIQQAVQWPTEGPQADYRAFGEMIQQSSFTAVLRCYFVLAALLTAALAMVHFQRSNMPRVEFFHVLCAVTAAFLLLVQSHHFVMLFVALETVTVGFYILVSYGRGKIPPLEAGLKYLIMGALSSSLLLFGIVLLYGAAGLMQYDGMNFTELARFIALEPTSNPLVLAGVALVLAGVAFKIGVFPFQIWIPDVYQGSPTPTTAFLTVASKAAGFFVLIHLLTGPFRTLDSVLVPLLSAIAAVTILFGNLAPLGQRNIKRLLGLSGVAHAGYLLAGVVAYYVLLDHGSDAVQAMHAILFYFFAYQLASYAVFGVLGHLGLEDDSKLSFDDVEDLGRRSPFLSGVLIVGLGSLAGIPPLAGFIGKFLLFIVLFKAELYGLLFFAIVGVVLSIYYYFGLMRESVFRTFRIDRTHGGQSDAEKEPDSLIEPQGFQRALLGLLALASVVFGLYQGMF